MRIILVATLISVFCASSLTFSSRPDILTDAQAENIQGPVMSCDDPYFETSAEPARAECEQ